MQEYGKCSNTLKQILFDRRKCLAAKNTINDR